ERDEPDAVLVAKGTERQVGGADVGGSYQDVGLARLSQVGAQLIGRGRQLVDGVARWVNGQPFVAHDNGVDVLEIGGSDQGLVLSSLGEVRISHGSITKA